jgi:hypothetical protein
MSDPDEFDRLHEEYLAFLDEGAGDYLQEHADRMADELGLDAADTVPIVGINPLTAEPYIMTLAMVGYKKMQNELFQVSVAWYPQPRLPVEIIEILNKDNVDIETEDIVAHLLRKRLAIVASKDDTDDADSVGWKQILKEVQTGERTTNFEDATSAEDVIGEFNEGLTNILGSLLSGNLDDMTFGDLVRAISEATTEAATPEMDLEATDYDESFSTEWM